MKWTTKFSAMAILAALPVMTQAQTVIEYIHTDALGSPVAVTDVNQQIVERTEYEPYGLQVNRALQDGPGYAGHASDAATGLSYMQQRYYDSGIGRFLSVDPVTADGATGGNFNRYWYANNNPYKFIDPDGRAACPKGSGQMCIEDRRSESGTTQQPGPGPTVQAKDAQVRVAFKSGQYSDNTKTNINEKTDDEQGFRVSETGTFSNPLLKICWSCSNGESGTGGKYNVSALKGNESPGHTHPLLLNGIPGRGDAGLTGVTHQTAYMISTLGAFAIEKTDVGYRIRQVAGSRVEQQQRSDMVKLVQFWNKNDGAAGGGGVTCSSKVC
ncbi:RHS repeat-associated core domain-containing protein [Lysobacter sp. Hz 25]|uniref:RHS repeat-associated core domain-containing protein n=1 Tax=Lysobacter sp. Hz 25 TaxID=3383698 RepID=UPI0038D41FD0